MASKKKPDDLSMVYFITLIAKYYLPLLTDNKSLSDIVKKELLEFDLDNYQEYKYHNKIMKICASLFDGSIDKNFREQEYIPIYENELKVIESLLNDRQKKLMFTFFALARYMNCDGWINKKTSKGISEAFKLANVTLTSDKRNELLHELYVNGYINLGKKVDNLNIKVQLDDSGEVVYKIKEFNNIGNQYIGNFKKGYKQCECCGKKIKITVGNRKYCRSCAEKINRNSTKERMKTMRNSKMFEADMS